MNNGNLPTAINKLNLPGQINNILKVFKENNFEIYIVGGAVRDILMGKTVTDWDFTTNATPDQILAILPGGFYDNKYGTVGIKVEGFDEPFEITTYRTEHGYSDNRRPDNINWGKTLEEDLKRRDFTINALALDGEKIIDLYHGKNDLKNRILRVVGNPNERFSEDALRLIRAVRIATELHFEIEENTFQAIRSNVALINKIAKERIKNELFKILKSSDPQSGILLLKETGLMQEILPELLRCFGVEQKSPNRHHIYDVGMHLINSLKECRVTDPITRFATLIHDIGKPQTFKKLETGVITFYNHEVVSTKIAGNIADRLRFSGKEKDKFIRLVRYHQFTVNENQTDSAIRRFIKNVGVENIPDMLELRRADRLGSGAKESSWRFEDFKKRIIEVQKQPFSIKDLKINGKDVMEILKIPSGPKVGQVLEKLFDEVTKNGLPNTKRALIEEIKRLKSF